MSVVNDYIDLGDSCTGTSPRITLSEDGDLIEGSEVRLDRGDDGEISIVYVSHHAEPLPKVVVEDKRPYYRKFGKGRY